jgi:hypothetical protein
MRRTLPLALLLSVHWRELRAWAHTRTHPRVHSIHWLLGALLRALVHHHGSTSTRARVAIDAWHSWWVPVARWHEMPLSSLGKHHLRAGAHALGGHEATGGVLHHDGWAHMGLLRHELMALGERTILRHGRSSRVLHHLGVISQLGWLVHGRWEGHPGILEAGRRKRLRGVRGHHAVLVRAIEWRVRPVAMVATLGVHRRLARGLSGSHVVRALLQVER